MIALMMIGERLLKVLEEVGRIVVDGVWGENWRCKVAREEEEAAIVERS